MLTPYRHLKYAYPHSASTWLPLNRTQCPGSLNRTRASTWLPGLLLNAQYAAYMCSLNRTRAYRDYYSMLSMQPTCVPLTGLAPRQDYYSMLSMQPTCVPLTGPAPRHGYPSTGIITQCSVCSLHIHVFPNRTRHCNPPFRCRTQVFS